MVLSSALIDRIFLRLTVNITLPITIISYGISYALYLCAGLIYIALELINGRHTINGSLFSFALVGIIQTIFCVLLFRLKRLHHGLPFLQNLQEYDSGIYLSVLLLIVVVIFGVNREPQRATAILLFYLMVSLIVFLWLWSKNFLTREYRKQLQKRDREYLQDALDQAQIKIKKLSQENEIFSTIIHRDNKLIPVMELAVRGLFHAALQAEAQGQPVQTDQIQEFIVELKRLSAERSGIVEEYEQISSVLPSTQIPILDALFSYMAQQAAQSGIQLELSISGNIGDMLSGSISQQDAYTVLADLIENAIIATASSSGEKRILVELGQRDGSDSICVSDSGVPFPAGVLKNWGTARVTTHGDSGGSGIGMMSTYEICKRYQASFSVEELGADGPFSKRIMLCFDHRDRFQYRELAAPVMDSYR